MTTQEGKIYLITGASSGMGKDAALYLASKNAKALALVSRSKDRLQTVADEISKAHPNTKTLVVAGDASSAEDTKRAVDETVSTFGGIHGAFINAGAYRGGEMIPEVSDQDIDDLLDINVKGVIYAMRYLIPAIKKTVGEDGPTGSIVVNSSCAGQAVIGSKSAGSAIYSASKAFVNSLVETAAVENAPRIRVNGVLPGVVQTNIMPVDDATYQAVGAAVQPLWGRPGKAREISPLVSFLLSDEASFISGTNVKADGLWSLSGGGM
uniref:Ketoreductase domain-containing protein n=1 Tax=Craspedostauros australis TaxID=1486917 RepID=A0A7R9ZTD3_9STRA